MNNRQGDQVMGCPPKKTESYEGLCNICGERGTFLREERPMRETYPCPTCRSSLRYRAQAEAILRFYASQEATSISNAVLCESFQNLSIYEPGIIGPFRRYFRNLTGYRQSFFWDGVLPGELYNGIECQDLMNLTYPNGSFDLVITSDIFEHVRRPFAAFSEVGRVLKTGGRHIFSIPLTSPMRKETFSRVDTSTEEDHYLVEPHYHGDGKGGRSLVYTDFGSDLLGQLATLGLKTEALAPGLPYSDLRCLLTFVSQKEA